MQVIGPTAEESRGSFGPLPRMDTILSEDPRGDDEDELKEMAKFTK